MSKVIQVQDGNLVLTAAGTDVVGDNVNIASFRDEYITTNNDSITFADSGNGGFYDTITSDDTGDFFGTSGFIPGMVLWITGSVSNDGYYTIGENGVTDTVITIIGGFTAETIDPAGVMFGISRGMDATENSQVKFISQDAATNWTIQVSNDGWLEIRNEAKDLSGAYVFDGHLGIFDYTESELDFTDYPTDADTPYATVGGWNDGQWPLWEAGVGSGSDAGYSVWNYTLGSGISHYVTDVSNSFLRRTMDSNYATGTQLYWPTDRKSVV